MTVDDRQQTRILARTFFGRLFENELMPAGLPQVQLVVSVFAFLAAPSLLLPLLLMKKYVWLWTPEALRMAMAQDRTMALLLAMTATAFITLATWENVFPDRRDCRILGVLPVRPRAMVLGRLAAVVALFVLVCVSTTAISSVAFGVLAAMGGLPTGFLAVAAAHFSTVAAAQGAVFFGILFVQCALLVVAGPGVAHRLAVVLQVLLIVAVMQMPMALPPGSSFALDAGGTPGWAHARTSWLMPPLWFLGLFAALLGEPYPGVSRMTALAAALGIAMPVLALAAYAASYRRLTRLAIEGRPQPAPRAAGRGWWLRTTAAALGRSPQGGAVCAFALRTLARSRQHRLLLAVWIGVALALTISSALPLIVRFGWARLATPSPAVLVGPLIFAALIQVGMRTLFAIPVEMRASWIFRACEPRDAAGAIEGAAAALVIAGVTAPALLALVTGWVLWGPWIAVGHALFCAAHALLLSQLLALGLDRVPFSVAYLPGSARIGKLWPLYLSLFSMATYGMADLEAAVLHDAAALARVVAGVLVVAGLLLVMRRRAARRLPGLRFEPDADEPTIVNLHPDRRSSLS